MPIPTQQLPDLDLPPGWIIVHELVGPRPKKDKPGPRIPVNAASVDSVCGYETGGATLTIRGAYLHVTESMPEVLALVSNALATTTNTTTPV